MVFEKPAVQPLRSLLADPEITEIMINGSRQMFVERRGKMEPVATVFTTPGQVQAMVEAFLIPTGRAVNSRSPFVDFRLPDGSRVNVAVPPVAPDGPIVTIRKFTRTIRSIDDLVQRGTLSHRMAHLLWACVRARLNIAFGGGTGTGKTTTVGVLSNYIDAQERIVVLEDTSELEISQPNVVRMECRPANMEGVGAITMGDLLRNSLRMRPTRLILGEMRGEEAFDMLNAMSSGHDGCMAVLHSSSPTHAIGRLEMMVLMKGLQQPIWAIQRQIASALDLIVQHTISADGVRRITHITEVGTAANDDIELRDLYEWETTGIDAQGKHKGHYVCTGQRPRYFDRIDDVMEGHADALFKPGPG